MGGLGITTGMKKVLDLAAKARTASGTAAGGKGSKGSKVGSRRPGGSTSAAVPSAAAAAPAAPRPAAAAASVDAAHSAPASASSAAETESVTPSSKNNRPKTRARTQKNSGVHPFGRAGAESHPPGDNKVAVVKGAGSTTRMKSGVTRRGSLAVGPGEGGGAHARDGGRVGEARVKAELGCSEKGGVGEGGLGSCKKEVRAKRKRGGGGA